MNTKYITIKELYGELLNHPLLQDLTLERVMYYAIEFCRKQGMSVLFDDKNIVLDVVDYKAYLPCDFYQLIAVRDFDTKINYRESANIWHKSNGEYDHQSNKFVVNNSERDGQYYGSDYQNNLLNQIIDNSVGRNNFISEEIGYQDFTYKLNGNVLFTSFTDNKIEVAYTAIASDDDGFPLILDDATYIQALKDYIKLQCFTILFDCGKIQNAVLANAQQQYGFSVRVLKNHFAMISPDEAETIGNILNTMLTYRGHHNGFRNSGNKMHFKIH